MSSDDIEASKAPLVEHLIELRQRLLRSVIAIAIAFVACFYFADDIFNLLIIPYERAGGEERDIKLIFTAPAGVFLYPAETRIVRGNVPGLSDNRKSALQVHRTRPLPA